MTVSKTATAGPASAPRAARKPQAKAATEAAALQMGELSELLGYSLKRAQLRIFEDFLRRRRRLSDSSKLSFLSLSIPCSYGTGLYVYPVLWHNRRVHKRTSRPRKNKATEWAIGQPLTFPIKGKISEPAKRNAIHRSPGP